MKAPTNLAVVTIAALVTLSACKDDEGTDPCEGETCSGYGECIVEEATDTPYCDCEDGFHAWGLTCVEVEADGDADSDTDDDAEDDVDGDFDDEADAELEDADVEASTWPDCTSTVPDDFDSIQGAIDESVDGDLVCVRPGRYRELIDFSGLSIHLLGVEGPEVTTIDGEAGGTVVVVRSGEGDSTVIEGLTITNGDSELGGGIIVDAFSSLVGRRLIVSNNQAVRGGGVFVGRSSSLDISLSAVHENSSSDLGGGIFVDGGSTLEAHRISFIENEAYQYGGAIYIEDESEAHIEQAEVRNNRSLTDGGGGIAVLDAVASLNNMYFVRNFAALAGGGLVVLGEANVTVINSLFASNSAGPNGGGGVYASSESVVVVSNSIFAGNNSTSGAGVRLRSMVNADFVNTVITESSGGGAAIEISESVLIHLSHCNVSENAGGNFVGMDDPTGTDGNISESPRFQSSSDSDPTNWDYHLDSDSPMIDRGSTSLEDPDESLSDIGAYGGPGAALWDLDWDGYPEWWQPGEYDHDTYPGLGWDCDDSDPDVHAEVGCGPE